MTASKYDYSEWENFSKEELVCQHTGKENPNIPEFTYLMDMVQLLRERVGIPFGVSSAYRAPEHPIEARKSKPGQHSIAAIDIQIPTPYVHEVIKQALNLGFTGIGVNMKGDLKTRFIHLDMRTSHPVVWSY